MNLNKKFGVVYCEKNVTRPWKVRVTINGVRKHIGYFKTEEEAKEVYIRIVKEIGEDQRLSTIPTNSEEYKIIKRGKNREYLKRTREEAKLDVINAYGGECQCCGEKYHEFLTIDHINGGGKKHRDSLPGGARDFYKWLKKQGFPKDNFRLLCMNCNFSYGHFGYCPHSKNRETECLAHQ